MKEKEKNPPITGLAQTRDREIVEEMKVSYLDYAMSVIVSRALPDVRDGMKPVQRRILYAMDEMGLKPGAKYQKSAKIVGHAMGNFHPHGDMAIYDAMVRLAQDFSLRYPLVDGQGNFGCFTGDTKVKLTDNRELSFVDLVKEEKAGKKNYTYTVNSLGLIAIASIQNPRLTRKNAELVKVTLDNGRKIKCTPDHRFMLRDGQYRAAQDLRAGDSLMPIYQRLSEKTDRFNRDGYILIYQNEKQVWVPAHHLADNYNLTSQIYSKSRGRVRHHIDFNKLNNNPDNITRLNWGEHWRVHYKHAKSQHQNPEYVAKLAQGRNNYWANPDNREKMSHRVAEQNRQWWQDPTYRRTRIAAVKKIWTNPEYKEMMRQASSHNLKRLWGNPDFKKLLSDLKFGEMRVRWQDPDFRKQMTERTRKLSLKLWADQKHRQHISQLNKAKWQDPSKRQAQSQYSKTLWQDQTFRDKFPVGHFQKMAAALWARPEMLEFHRNKARVQLSNPDFRDKFFSAGRAAAQRFLIEHPSHMQVMTNKAAVVLKNKWQDPNYRAKVIRSKISGFVNKLLQDGRKLDQANYDQARTNNGIPKFTNALGYFSGLAEMEEQARLYNHKVVKIERLIERADVYDLTIDKTHNFALADGIFVHNSVDGDPAAAQRYTEARLAKISGEILNDIDKETVDFVDNYDASQSEPVVLPAMVPNLLINGTMGIAVGMATNIPPHNLGEVVDGLVHLIEEPESDVQALAEHIKGPDFPTGGTIYNQQDIMAAYATGKGSIVMRAKTEIVEDKKGFQIIVSELPYQVNKAELIKHIAELHKDKKLDGIRDIRDESDREGLRVVVELKADAFPRKVLNQLFKFTELQRSFHVNMVALVDGIQPQLLGLKTVLEKFIQHRQVIVTRRTQFDLRQAKARAHILEGLKTALDHIDAIIKLIRASDSQEAALVALMKKFSFSQLQATAILEMKLRALAGLERKKIEDELKEKLALIAYLEDLLAHPKKILGVIKAEFLALKEKYGDERRTKIVKTALREIGEEELIPEQDSLFMVTADGYIKRMPPDAVRAQKRGGKGLMGMATKEEDMVSQFFMANTHDTILFFTSSGKTFRVKGYEVPESSRQAKGKAIVNWLNLGPEESVTAVVPLAKEQKSGYLFMATVQGVIKKTDISEFENVRANGLNTIKLHPADQLRWVQTTTGKDEIIMTASDGNAIRFKEKDVRPMGRAAAGVIGMRLNKDSKIVGAQVVPADLPEKDLKLLVVTQHGYGKRTELRHYKLQKRGGKGIKAAQITTKTGALISAHVVNPENKEIIAASQKGQVIRTELDSISTLGRATQGVRIMRLDSGDSIASVVLV